MTGQPSGRVTWDKEAGEYVQWHGRAHEIAHPASRQQDRPAEAETSRDGRR